MLPEWPWLDDRGLRNVTLLFERKNAVQAILNRSVDNWRIWQSKTVQLSVFSDIILHFLAQKINSVVRLNGKWEVLARQGQSDVSRYNIKRRFENFSHYSIHPVHNRLFQSFIDKKNQGVDVTDHSFKPRRYTDAFLMGLHNSFLLLI